MTPDSHPVVLRVGGLIDGDSDEPIRDAGIRLHGSTVAAVGAWSTLDKRPDDELVDLSRYVAVPGFVDAHAHVTLFADGRPNEAMAAESDDGMLRAAARNLRRHLECGVTTVRDNGSRGTLGIALRDAVASGEILGPQLLVSGPVVTKPRGHFHLFGIEADDSDDVRAAVERLAADGVDHIKIMASGGDTVGTDPRSATYSVDELRTVVRAAHAHGLLTTAHCRAVESMRRAAEAGVDCIEHAEFLWPDGRMEFDEQTGSMLARSSAYISPTLPAYGQDSIVRLRAAQSTRPLSDEERSRLTTAERELAAVVESFRQMLERGLGPRMIGGSDAGPADFSFGHVDYCVELMVRGGMSHMEAIRACTSVAAQAIGLGDSRGAVRAGAQADIVILGSDPLARIDAVADVRAVVKAGRTVVGDLRELASDRPSPGVPDSAHDVVSIEESV